MVLQEQTGNEFGPGVQSYVNHLMSIYKNLVVECSSSGNYFLKFFNINILLLIYNFLYR